MSSDELEMLSDESAEEYFHFRRHSPRCWWGTAPHVTSEGSEPDSCADWRGWKKAHCP